MMEGSGTPDLNKLLGWVDPQTNLPYLITHRQVLAWREYHQLSMNYPDRSDLYGMNVACQVARSNAKHPNTLQPMHFKLTVGKDSSTMTKAERDRIAVENRNARIARFGGIERYTVMKLNEKGELELVRPALVGPGTPNPGRCINPLMRQPNAEEWEAHRKRIQSRVTNRGRRNSADGS